ncbi:NADH-quinone oxidoreductase subunit J [Buchnera aphidicola (Pemphigus obesinymphae)]|uniref:NADH-quinone oxidoreductase subunit J n=1 Tax=Buchnera aphidicola TaxID=9 RepID=UPI002238EEF5|nr:NADH-quinone oxidoreductase subunit J [Buchnera aphidicola]MCW5196563.1 NADH-quinone oxidoreductase subunit J [Buchnera aphidicola (Pemphigus obesinymphae)]
MESVFYILGMISIISTIFVILHSNPVYALIYFIVSLLSISGIFFILGGYFAAVLEIIIYAGAIMVLFTFVLMLLNLGKIMEIKEKKWLKDINWIIISLLFLSFFITVIYGLSFTGNLNAFNTLINTKMVGISLFGPYVLIVELSSILLLSALVVVFHFGKEK